MIIAFIIFSERVMQSKRLDSLTSLRAFAALGVFFSHMGFIQNSSNEYLASTFKYFNLGYSGVTFFFILSGFILTYSFTNTKKVSVVKFSDFLMHRIFRIYPVHILCLFIFIVSKMYYMPEYSINESQLIKNALLLQSFSVNKNDYFSFNAVSWSISVEMFFYVCFCFVIFAPKRTIFVFSALLIAIIIYLSSLDAVSESISHWFYYISPLMRLPDFMIGILICKLYLCIENAPSKFILSVAESVSLISIAISLYIAANVSYLGGLKFDVIFIPSMAFAVLAFSFNGGVISKLISSKAFILFGDASFAFYLIHAIVISVLHRYIDTSKTDLSEAISFIAIALVISMITAIFIFILYEKPINKKLRAVWDKIPEK